MPEPQLLVLIFQNEISNTANWSGGLTS